MDERTNGRTLAAVESLLRLKTLTLHLYCAATTMDKTFMCIIILLNFVQRIKHQISNKVIFFPLV